MDVFDDEILDLWQSLSTYNVRYIMVGGFATFLNGFERTTNDLDIWLEDTVVNRQNLRKSLNALDYPDYPAIETMQFVAGWSSLRMGQNIELDIMTEMKGLENLTFDECLNQASIADINGIIIPFCILTNSSLIKRQ
ncbi:hypothetical protein [Mucilaginibacter antarcticus]|uniref:hypothetical protein n=1 Tax=Mucilaginibacter antarcticus TaxID=1855725 RepID=UPI003640E1CC